MMLPTPRQTRSARTLERILEACDRLLEERDFQAITMQDIAREAGVSVGNLYNRFPDRGALVEHIVVRQQAAGLERLAAGLAAKPAAPALRARLEQLVHVLSEAILPARPVLISALGDGAPARSEGEAAGSDRLVDVCVDWLVDGDPALGSARERCRFAVASIAFQLQFDLLFGTGRRLFGDDFAPRIADQAHAVLTIEEP